VTNASDAVSISTTRDRDVVPRTTWNTDLALGSEVSAHRSERRDADLQAYQAQWREIASGAME
jgi:hypothetical protein